ncbi:MAG: TetR family transcriptional regulator [Candidatus Lokiarchaeota archaeon]|nr:TetR family transcriptional regulator [Candidatus Lokiarchaeota archaeon]
MPKDKIKRTAKEKRRERERQLRKKSIIDVAEKSFVGHGYEDTMVDQVAADAGYTKATIYNYFDSKEDLFTAVLTGIFENLYVSLEMFQKDATGKRGFRSLGDAYVAFVDKYPSEASLINWARVGLVIRKVLEKQANEETLTESEEEFITLQLKIQALMTRVIKQTLEESGIGEKVDPQSVIVALSALGPVIRDLAVRGKDAGYSLDESRQYLDVLLTIIEKGLIHYDK